MVEIFTPFILSDIFQASYQIFSIYSVPLIAIRGKKNNAFIWFSYFVFFVSHMWVTSSLRIFNLKKVLCFFTLKYVRLRPQNSVCHGIFTDRSIFCMPILLWKRDSSGPVTQWRQLVSCDWSWHSHRGLIPGKFDQKINRSENAAYQEMVYCSGSNSTSHMKTKGFCFQLPLINIRRESAKMKFKSSQNCRRVI